MCQCLAITPSLRSAEINSDISIRAVPFREKQRVSRFVRHQHLYVHHEKCSARGANESGSGIKSLAAGAWHGLMVWRIKQSDSASDFMLALHGRMLMLRRQRYRRAVFWIYAPDPPGQGTRRG
jgi:hypothetical protein